nr:gamma-glutamyltransferase [Mesorhizobium delmotii]
MQVYWNDAISYCGRVKGALPRSTERAQFRLACQKPWALDHWLRCDPVLAAGARKTPCRVWPAAACCSRCAGERLADEGFIPPHHLAAAWALNADALAKGGAGPYLKDARPPARFRHIRLAALLRAFGECSAAAITSGETARSLADGVRSRGGHWRAEDLAANAALDGEVLYTSFRDCEVITIGRQGWGHTLIELLSILDHLPLFGDNLTGAEACRLIAVIETCFADRPQRLGSLEAKPGGLAFETLIAPDFVAARAAEIARRMAEDSPAVAPDEAPTTKVTEGKDTTHLSALDAEGATVALSMSIGPYFGLRATDAAFGLLPRSGTQSS